MRRKVFVSYKYADWNVSGTIPGDSSAYGEKVRDYVTVFENKCTDYDLAIYKGESDDEDLSHLSDNTIWEKLKDRIYDSSVTILFISSNMYEYSKEERNQWIPQEIYYSLRHTTRNGRTSASNALLYVILPDWQGSYDYTKSMKQFRIVNDNWNYAYQARWTVFIDNPKYYIEQAIEWKNEYGNRFPPSIVI